MFSCILNKRGELPQRYRDRQKLVTIQVSLLGDSSLPAAVRKYFVVSAGGAAGGTARTHYKNERAAVECRFIEHVRRGVLKSYKNYQEGWMSRELHG